MAAATSTATRTLKTVAVLGASYGGARAAQLLANDLPQGWRVVLVDRNSHMNHLYVLPRYAVLPGHEHKAFIPYDNVFQLPTPYDAPKSDEPPLDLSRHVMLHASVTELKPHAITLDRSFPEHGISDNTLRFEYLVYALGSHLPSPINLWGTVADDVEKDGVVDVVRGTKEGGMAWLKKFQKRVERASSVLVVGGGALGIQYATDIAEIHPTSQVTLLHSRHRLLPRFDDAMHTEILSTLSALNVCTILGDRLDLSSLSDSQSSITERIVRTQSGREIRADLVLLCTGQTPNTTLLGEAFPNIVITDGPNKGMARVRRTLQLAEPVDDLPVVPNPPAEIFAPQTAVATPVTEEPPVEPSSPELPESPIEELSEDEEEEEPEPVEEDPHTKVATEHIFAIGDAADAFGAVNAGHNAFFQGEVAARNIVKLIKRAERDASEPSLQSIEPLAPAAENVTEEPEHSPESESPTSSAAVATAVDDLELQKYAPGAPAIKVSLGLTKSVYQFQGMIGTRDKEPADLDVHLIWRYFGYNVSREDLERDQDTPVAAPAEAGALTA
ncbi:FAD/NAD-P-binding domain-containing protein [Lenzites betulinus]|nr:FAD/NAD-P-binding domain-containing protein [Lenzites betulinus]